MFALLLLLACGGEPASDVRPEPAPGHAPKTKAPKGVWTGEWTMGDKALAIDPAGEVKLMQGGEVLKSGQLEGKGRKRTAALDGCGATLTQGETHGELGVALDGPECPVEFAGTWTLNNQ